MTNRLSTAESRKPAGCTRPSRATLRLGAGRSPAQPKATPPSKSPCARRRRWSSRHRTDSFPGSGRTTTRKGAHQPRIPFDSSARSASRSSDVERPKRQHGNADEPNEHHPCLELQRKPTAICISRSGSLKVMPSMRGLRASGACRMRGLYRVEMQKRHKNGRIHDDPGRMARQSSDRLRAGSYKRHQPIVRRGGVRRPRPTALRPLRLRRP